VDGTRRVVIATARLTAIVKGVGLRPAASDGPNVLSPIAPLRRGSHPHDQRWATCAGYVSGKRNASGQANRTRLSVGARHSRSPRSPLAPATLYRYIPAARTANTASVADFSETKPTASVFTFVR
jgi:hypothetical protein